MEGVGSWSVRRMKVICFRKFFLWKFGGIGGGGGFICGEVGGGGGVVAC